MSKQPAVVIIARHGARLDQANKDWHMTSPTPYDPPLTYGGWLQSRALGTKIASLLETRQNEIREHPPINETIGESWTHEQEMSLAKRKRKRGHRVIIHSSPFTRCVQTSIAISAGIGQFEKRYDKSVANREAPDAEEPENHKLISDLPESNGDIKLASRTTHKAPLVPTSLRIDAFLGEWLSPGYFENITPPPASVLMVASAKAELLRPAELIMGSDFSANSPQIQYGSPIFNGRHGLDSPDIVGKTGLRAMAAAGNSMRKTSNILTTVSEDIPFYVPPSPNYAISSSQPIPAGYVAHARDACTKVELQWDSMRPPLDWGDGGEYEEDWSTMHRRFRTGLQRMLLWYELDPVNIHSVSGSDEDEDDLDTVLILVTHGAGCNAMIGAMTGQPVLIDVGTASLTMAVRKEGPDSESSPVTPTLHRRKSVDLGIADKYDMKIMASREHIQGNLTPYGTNSPRVARSPTVPSRKTPTTELSDSFSIGESLSWRPSSSGGLSRSSSQRVASDVPVPKFATGLWKSKTSSLMEDSDDSSDSDVLPNFQPTSSPLAADIVKREEFRNVDPPQTLFQLPTRTNTQDGLWGSTPAMINTTKRRWTLVDNP